MYRRSAKPAPTTATIPLLPSRGRNWALGGVGWFLVAPAVFFAAHVAVQLTFDDGGAVPAVQAPVLAALAATFAPIVVWRLVRRETIWLGARSIRVAGVLFDRSMRWSEVEHVERAWRRRRNRSYPVLRLHSSRRGRPLELHPQWLEDPRGALQRALTAVEEGDLRPIEPMVRAEATKGRPLLGFLPHVAFAAILFAIGIAVIAPAARETAQRRALVETALMPAPAAMPRLSAIFADDAFESETRCRAGSKLAMRLLSRGDHSGALAQCQAMQGFCTRWMPYRAVRCEGPFTALPAARSALREGRAQAALAELGSHGRAGLDAEAMHAEILAALGRADESREVAEHCTRRLHRDPVEDAIVERCEALAGPR